MTPTDILEELKKFTTAERLAIIEAALHQTCEDLAQAQLPDVREERKQQLRVAAEALLPDYAARADLTVFTALDSEDFHA
jgi:hypothetical protein